MNAPGMKRPTGVTVTAWLWIVMGGFMVFSAIMGGFAYMMMRQMGAPPAIPPGMPAGLEMMNAVFRHFGALLAVQAIVAALSVWAGIALLQLKAWARAAIEALSWLALLYSVGFGIYWVYLWIAITGQMPAGNAPVDTALFQVMGVAIGVIITAAFVVPLWIMIRYLRGNEMRAAIAAARQAR
jgi:hypothetical protein